MNTPLSKDDIIAAVSEQLQIPVTEIDLTDDLLMLGLDSVRLMSLVGKWKSEGVQVNFIDLAVQPTLESWIEKLTHSR